MKEIDYPDMRRANNGAHGSFMQSVSKRLNEDSEVMKNTVMQRAAEALKVAVAEEASCLGQPRKSVLTNKIKTADKERDGLLAGLRATVRGLTRMPDEEMAQAAKTLNVLIGGVRVKRSMQLDRETGMIAKLTEELEGTYAAQVAQVGLGVYVKAIKEANERVEKLLVERSERQTGHKPKTMQLARAQADKAFRQVARVANAMAVLEDEAVVAPFIDFVNELIRRYRQQVFPRRRKAKMPEE